MSIKTVIYTAIASFISATGVNAYGEQSAGLTMTLQEVISRAQENSPSAQSAKHAFLAAEWQYKYYQANYLPSVTLTSSPFLNREINKITLNDGTSAFIKQNQINADLALTVNQNISFTGGSLFLKSSLSRIDELERKNTSYSSIPITIGYRQSIFGYNYLKWDRRIEPLRYREAKKNYEEAMELVAAHACGYFFSLVEAQTNLEMARLNFASADTLYQMAQGRYKIGVINENDMIQLEINRLNAETACMDAEVQVNEQSQLLASYLRLDDLSDMTLQLPLEVPDIEISLPIAEEMAKRNASQPDYYRRLKLESDSRVAQAKGNTGLRADIYLQFGLSQTSDSFEKTYRHPLHQEYASLTLSLPILDWGRGKGQVKVAKSQRDLVYTEADQGMSDFMQNVRKIVTQFNMQPKKVEVASRTNRLASHRYEIARRLYIAGRNTILDLNTALSEKDSATRAYISSIKTYWTLYYTIRSLTGKEIMNDTSW
ncbi:MAG: TolC family protein [Muribaculaceae bacterium]|nr:TolC family protein [Muribaculaceae bacterium]